MIVQASCCPMSLNHSSLWVTGIAMYVKLASDYPNVHGGYGYSSCNPDGERILEFAGANKLVVGDSLFNKKDSRLVTYCSGLHKTLLIDYMLFRKNCRKSNNKRKSYTI